MWGAAEPAVTIMAASVPMMRVLVQTVPEAAQPNRIYVRP